MKSRVGALSSRKIRFCAVLGQLGPRLRQGGHFLNSVDARWHAPGQQNARQQCDAPKSEREKELKREECEGARGQTWR